MYEVYRNRKLVATSKRKQAATEIGKELSKSIREDTEVKSRVVPEPVANCLHSVKLQIAFILEQTCCKEYDIWLSPAAETFRHRLATIKKYKGNRDPLHRPLHYDAITTYLVGRWGALTAPEGVEADDVLAWSLEGNPDVCIATIDKDLDQVSGWHYNFVKKEMYYIDPDEAIYNLHTQALVGDSTDNIQGCPGIGPVKARKILEKCTNETDMIAAVKAAYVKAFAPHAIRAERNFNENMRLVYLLRSPEDEGWAQPKIK